MKKHNSGMSVHIKFLFLIFFIGVGLFFFVGQFLMPATPLSDNDFCQPLHDGWFRVTETGKREPFYVPGKCEAKRNEAVTIERTLPSDVEGNTLCFRSARQEVAVYIDGKLREQYTTLDTRLFGKTSAAAYVFVDFTASDAGKTISIVTTTDSSYSGVIQDAYYGTTWGIWKKQFKIYGMELMIAVLVLILALVSIIVSLVIKCCYHKQVLLGALGFGVMLCAIWIICNSVFRQLIFNELNVVSDIPFFMLMLIPIPFLLYMDGIQNERYHKGFVALELTAVADFILFTILQLTNTAEFADTISYISIVCCISIVWIVFTVFLDTIHKKIKEYWLIAFGILVSLFSGCAQILLYFQRTKPFNGSYIALGLVFLLVSAVISTVQDVVRMGKERQKAIYASRSKAQFLANVSHEIRTPINAVLGLDEMILQKTNQDIVRDYAGDIQSAGRSLLALINDILDFSKIESGKMQITPAEYSVFSMLSDCYHMIFMRAREKGLKLYVRNQGNIPSRLFGDEVRVRQIIINLLTNAVKYTKQGSITLIVEGRMNEKKEFVLVISVEDTGIGIKRDNIDNLFNSFQRLDVKKNKDIEGTGLGLAITHQLLEIMGGNIHVDSVYGEGSVFRVEIPQGIVDAMPIGELSAQFMEDYRENTSKKESLHVSRGKILVVDDVVMNLKVFQGLLSESGLEIHTAESGAECLEMVEKEAYQMIFLDHMMPDMDGVETFHAIKNLSSDLNRDTPIIMLTANALVGAREEYLAEGFEDYLSKPVKKSDLEKMLQTYLPEKCFVQKKAPESSSVPEHRENSFQERFAFLDIKTGLEYCGDSIDIYRETICAFQEKDQLEKLEHSFKVQEWKNYQIYVHGLKGTALSIGAMELYEISRKIEMAVREENIDFAERNHRKLIQVYRELLLRIKMALKSE